MLKLSDISIRRLRSGQFLKELPEFYELKNCVENNSWHSNESVFDHTLRVLEELENILKNANSKIKAYLDQKIDRHTKRELLFLGTMFHDIAKNDVMIKNCKITGCPKHEEVGSEKVKSILSRLDLSEQEKARVIKIVRCHSDIHLILEPNNSKFEKQYDEFKSGRNEIFIELILLAMADTLGSQLKDNKPEEFRFRNDFYRQIVDNY